MALLSFFWKNKGLSAGLVIILALFITAWVQGEKINNLRKDVTLAQKDYNHLMLRVSQLKKDSTQLAADNEELRAINISQRKDYQKTQEKLIGSGKGLSSALPSIEDIKKKK